MTVTVTGSDHVVAALARAGGVATRTEVLRAVTAYRGRREAGLAVEMAVLAGRVERVILRDGRPGLRLMLRDELEAARS